MSAPFRPAHAFSYCTFGYVLSMNHPREDIRLLYPKRLRAYALEPALITQLPKHQAGSDTEASPFVNGPTFAAELPRFMRVDDR